MMQSKSKLVLALVGGAAVLAVTIGLAAFGFTTTARANDATGQPGFGHRGGPQPLPGKVGQIDTFLADALGISVEELHSAQTAAYEAAIDQALSNGLITQAQADQLKSGDWASRGMRGLAAGFVFGPEAAVDHESLLADALGISGDELSSAREQAQSARIAQAVADGVITQERADQLAARQALQVYIDPQAIMAEALGVSVDTLQAYRDEGMSMTEILSQTGQTASEFVAARQTAYETAVQKAVGDGVITQAQADQAVLAGPRGFFGGRGGHAGFGVRPDHGRLPQNPGTSTSPEANDTSL